MKIINILKTSSLTTIGTWLIVGSVISAEKSNLPQSAFFGGLGGGWSSGSFGNQQVYGKGTSYSPAENGNTAQVGSAAGSTSLELNSQSALAPVVQVGYFKHFSDMQWLWGGKFSYSYLNIGSATSDLQIPQAGGFNENGSYTPFTGNYLVQSYRQNMNHQMSIIPFIGRSFNQSYLYLGLGPTTVQTKTYIDGITGFEDVYVIPTTPTGIGLGKKYSTTQWLYGGIAMVGATYFVDSSWFVDISFAYAITGQKTSNWGGPWTDTDTSRSNVMRTGTNTGTSTGSVNTQALVISINKTFES